MILDIVFILIVLICGINGFRKGFLHTLIHLLGWIASIVIAFSATPYVKEFLISNTNLYDEIVPKNPVAIDIPKIIENSVFETASDVIFTVVVFFLILLVIKFVVWFLLHLLTKRDRKTFTGAIDGIFGFILGVLKGLVLVFVIVVVVMPLTEIFVPNLAEQFETFLDSSKLTELIYNYNPIWLLGR